MQIYNLEKTQDIFLSYFYQKFPDYKIPILLKYLQRVFPLYYKTIITLLPKPVKEIPA